MKMLGYSSSKQESIVHEGVTGTHSFTVIDTRGSTTLELELELCDACCNNMMVFSRLVCTRRNVPFVH